MITNAARPANYKMINHILLSRTNMIIEDYWTLKARMGGKWVIMLKEQSLDFLREYLPSIGINFADVPQFTRKRTYR